MGFPHLCPCLLYTSVKILKEKYPQLNITVIVRGYPVVNDATMEDAEEIGLTDIVKVTGNGSNVGGTWFPGLSNEARTLLEQADVILAKGKVNFCLLFTSICV